VIDVPLGWEETPDSPLADDDRQMKGFCIMDQEQRRKQSFLLRLPISVREQATMMAREEGTSLNHFISLAVAEKLSRMANATSSLKPSVSRLEDRSQPMFRNLKLSRIA
jgi:hypothetical protein